MANDNADHAARSVRTVVLVSSSDQADPADTPAASASPEPIVRIPRAPHPWNLNPAEAAAVQRRLSKRVRLEPAPVPGRIAGIDCAFLDDAVIAVAVVWDVPGRRVLETRAARAPLEFPYVPGLLSFREAPALLAVLRRLVTPVGGILCDGQGISHPRRFGLASHIGLITGVPTAGCAKSRLCGSYREPGNQRGSSTPLMDGPERIGTVLRTRDGVKPVFVSPGHLCDFESSIEWVLACGAGYRLPEPTRLADRLVARYRKAGRFRGGLCPAENEAG